MRGRWQTWTKLVWRVRDREWCDIYIYSGSWLRFRIPIVFGNRISVEVHFTFYFSSALCRCIFSSCETDCVMKAVDTEVRYGELPITTARVTHHLVGSWT